MPLHPIEVGCFRGVEERMAQKIQTVGDLGASFYLNPIRQVYLHSTFPTTILSTEALTTSESDAKGLWSVWKKEGGFVGVGTSLANFE